MMKDLVEKIAGQKAVGIYQLMHRSALHDWGWFTSLNTGFPSDKAGNPIPWISYPAFEVIRKRVNAAWNVFEFGAGYSTIWWGRNAHSVVSCEHDAEWCQKLAPMLPSNCTLIERALDDGYPLIAKETQMRYDVIVIDGRRRVKCALNSVDCLSDAGVMIWDDSDRTSYQEGLDYLTALGFKRLDLVGMSPRTPAQKQTSIIYRARNVLDI